MLLLKRGGGQYHQKVNNVLLFTSLRNWIKSTKTYSLFSFISRRYIVNAVGGGVHICRVNAIRHDTQRRGSSSWKKNEEENRGAIN